MALFAPIRTGGGAPEHPLADEKPKPTRFAALHLWLRSRVLFQAIGKRPELARAQLTPF